MSAEFKLHLEFIMPLLSIFDQSEALIHCATEVLWGDLQKAGHGQKPTNLAQLEKYSHEEWTKISAKRFQRPIESWHTRLQALIYALEGNVKY